MALLRRPRRLKGRRAHVDVLPATILAECTRHMAGGAILGEKLKVHTLDPFCFIDRTWMSLFYFLAGCCYLYLVKGVAFFSISMYSSCISAGALIGWP